VPDQVAALREGSIDVAVLRPPVSDPTMAVRVLRRERLVVALPADHRLAARRRVSVRDLRDDAFIAHSGRRESVMFGTLLSLCRAAGFTPTVRHEVDETSTLVTLVAGGLGVALVPEPVSTLMLGGVVYVPVGDKDATTELAVAHVADRVEPHLVRAVAEIERIVAAHPR